LQADVNVPGSVLSGYESHTFDHFHVIRLESMTGRRAVTRVLCQGCYLRDYAEAYPGLPAPFSPMHPKA
jgi:hypothetical protein